METNLSFGQAVEAAKKGKLIAREGWNGKGMFVMILGGSYMIPLRVINDIHQFFPIDYRTWLYNKLQSDTLLSPEIQTLPHFVMKSVDDLLVVGWLASQTDMLATDWLIVPVGPDMPK